MLFPNKLERREVVSVPLGILRVAQLRSKVGTFRTQSSVSKSFCLFVRKFEDNKLITLI